MPPETAPDQFDLVPLPQPSERPEMPRWPSLPAQTRRTLTELMARLILAHVNGEPTRDDC